MVRVTRIAGSSDGFSPVMVGSEADAAAAAAAAGTALSASSGRGSAPQIREEGSGEAVAVEPGGASIGATGDASADNNGVASGTSSPRYASMAARAPEAHTASSPLSASGTASASASAPAAASLETKAELLAQILSSTANLPPSDDIIETNPYLLRRTAKEFNGDLFYGTVVQCRWVKSSQTHFAADSAASSSGGGEAKDGDKEPCWLVVYDDGDAEDVNADELAGGMVLFEQDQRHKDKGSDDSTAAGGSDQKKKETDSCCSVVGCCNTCASAPTEAAADGDRGSQGNMCDFHRCVHRVVHEKISWEEAQDGLDGGEEEANGEAGGNVGGAPMDESGLDDTETEQEEDDAGDEDFSTASPERRRGRSIAAAAGRKSSRATKFQRNVDEDSGSADEGGADAPPPGDSADKKKNPASTHTSPRKRLSTKKPVYDINTSDEDEDYASEGDGGGESSDGESGEDEEKLKMARIIACRTETVKRWREIGTKMNTTEVTDGSRWFQETTELKDEDTEERYLIKWRDLSMLHCSWETKRDLMAESENPKPYFATFQRKNVDGMFFDEDERGDGEYFDPKFVEIERILHAIEAPVPSPPPSRSSSPSGGSDGVRRRLDLDEPTEKRDEKRDEDNKTKSGQDDSKGDGAGHEKTRSSISQTKTMVEQGIILDRNDPRYEDGTGRQFLIKWGNTPYSQCSYEFERDLILNDVEYESHYESFILRSQKPTQSEFNAIEKVKEEQKRRLYKIFGENARGTQEERDEKIAEFQRRLFEEEFGENGNKLRDYQAEGVAWLISNYVNKRSSVLADEMGLGKTVQVASYLSKLAKESHIRGPFLIVVPLSTIEHWLREFAGWTELNTILYHGSADDRALIREYEFAYHLDRPKNTGNTNNFLRRCQAGRAKAKWQRTWMAQVVITTPEIMTADDFSELMAVKWEVLVVDEAHRVKNFDSKLANNLFSPRFSFGNRVLMTGTPIQNNMQELWTILHFTDPSQFNDQEEFLEKFDGMRNKEVLDELHETMRPYILRRLKEDVEKSVPPKEETIIEVELTILQKQYYRALYEKNVKFLHRNKKKALDGPSISNLAVQLRKCCNHPFLLRGCEDDARKAEGVDATDRKAEADFLVRASGKLVLLDKLLPRLQEDDHRVLIFSQFCIMLDILTDYLDLRDFKHERIDGNVTGKQRQAAIDRFQAEAQDGKKAPFVMLLSTRAGGVGINLTAADTCIIFDSDWNPQNDLQAQARCHRIGQTKQVKVYRLITAKSYEMQMFHASSLKLGLDQAVLQGIEGGTGNAEKAMSKDEIEKLLRKGAYDVFSEEQAETSDQAAKDFENLDIDSILSRRTKTVVHENTGSNSAAAGGTFSKASFKAANQGGSADVDIDDPDFWKKVVGEAKEEEEEVLGKRKRIQTKSYTEYFEEPAGKKSVDAKAAEAKDSDYSSAGADEEGDEDSMADVEPVNAAELVDGNGASGKTSIGSSGKKRRSGKKPKKSADSSIIAKRKFVRVRGIVISEKERPYIRLIKNDHKILVLHPLPRNTLQRADEIVSVNGFVVQHRVDAKETSAMIQRIPAMSKVVLDVIRPFPPHYPAPIRDVVTGYGYTESFPPNFHPILGDQKERGGSTSTSPHPNPTPVAISLAIQVSKERPQLGVSVASNAGRHFVHGISSSGAASTSKLRVGDEIIGLNGKRHSDWTVLLKEINNVKALGLPLRLNIVQHEKRKGAFIQGIVVDKDPKTGKFGMDLQWRSSIRGVFVNKITPETPAANSSIRLGDEIVSANRIRLTGPDWTFKTIMAAIKRLGDTSLCIDVFRPSKSQTDSSRLNASTALATSAPAPKDTTTAASLTPNSIPQVKTSLPDRNTATKLPQPIQLIVTSAPPPRRSEPVPGSSAWCSLQKELRAKEAQKSQEASMIAQSKKDHAAPAAAPTSAPAVAPAPATAANTDGANPADIPKEVAEPLDSEAEGVLIEVEIPPRKEAPTFGMVLELSSSGLPRVEKFFPFSVIGQTGKVKIGDYVLSMNGRSMRATGVTMDDVKKAFSSIAADTALTIEILRPASNAASTDTSCKVIKGISIHREANDEPFGMVLHNGGTDKKGRNIVFCSGIKRGSATMREGTLKEKDVILAINGTDLTDRRLSFNPEVLDLVRSTKPGAPLILDIMRMVKGEGVLSKIPAEVVSPKEAPRREGPAEKASSKGTPSKTLATTNDKKEGKSCEEAETPVLLPQQEMPVASVSSNKRGRPKKDPNHPKLPRSPYIFFFVEMHPKVMADFPGKASTEVTAMVANQWRDLTAEQRKKYIDLHDQDEERYASEKAEYERKQVIEGTGPAEAGASRKDPKRTPSGRPACVVEGCTKQHQGRIKNFMCNKHFTLAGGEAGATASSPAPASLPPKTPISKRKTPSQSASPSKSPSNSSTKKPRSGSRKPCSVDHCAKGCQSGTNGLCVSHWNEQVKALASANGASYKDMRVAKNFGTTVFFGTIKTYFEADASDPKSVTLWNVVYDDGDDEDLNVRELAGALRLYNHKSEDDPKAAATTGTSSSIGHVDQAAPVDLTS